MTKRAFPLLLLAMASFAAWTPVRAQAPQQEAKPPEAMPKFDLESYQLGLLRKGPNSGTGTKEEMEKVQEGHMANIGKMAAAGKLMAAGPMLDDGDLRGIFLFKAGSLDEARALTAPDPAIQAGRLQLDLFSWSGPKGIGAKLNEEYRKNPDVPMTMTKVHLVLLKRGAAVSSEAEKQKLLLAHLWSLRRMMDEGKMLAAGPLQESGELAGITVLATDSMEQAEAWAKADPAVQAGHLIPEIHPWFVAKEVWP